MNVIDILAKFLELHPHYHEQTHQYAPNGKNTIRIWFRDGRIFDFTYTNEHIWNLIRCAGVCENKYNGRFLR